MTHTFRITGMHCGSCALLVDDTLTDLTGVISTETSRRTSKSVVRVDPSRCSPVDVIEAISELGYEAALVS